MNCHVKRAAQSCHVFAFATRPLAVANLAYATAPDLSFAPATLNFKYQVGSALPAAQLLQFNSKATPLPSPARHRYKVFPQNCR
jgi:hypothetical protein